MGIENEVSPSAGQRWSTQKPTVPGWYWYRNDSELCVLNIDWSELVERLYVNCDGDDVLENYDGEWLGPITPTDDAALRRAKAEGWREGMQEAQQEARFGVMELRAAYEKRGTLVLKYSTDALQDFADILESHIAKADACAAQIMEAND